MKFDFVVIGATGMQGKIVARDLLENGYSVLLCGRDRPRVDRLMQKYSKTGFQYLDLNDAASAVRIIKNSGANVVVNCAEGDWDLAALEACVKAGVHSLDLGSDIPMTKDQLAKDSVLKKKNLIHITGCGSVPGIGNVMLNYASQKFNTIKNAEVGFAWDSNIKKFVVPFSIQSIIEEFTAFAPYFHKNHIVKVKPMDSIVKCHHRSVGKERQFNVGHHPETHTFYQFCKDKGIEDVKFYAGFPNHSFHAINHMISLGFGKKDPIDFNGKKVRPIEFLTATLKHLEIPEGYKETENLWVELSNGRKKILMECIVPTLKGWEDAGCNVDTGMPASIIAQMIKTGLIKEPGSYSPEFIVPPEPFFKELKKRKMRVYENGRLID